MILIVTRYAGGQIWIKWEAKGTSAIVPVWDLESLLRRAWSPDTSVLLKFHPDLDRLSRLMVEGMVTGEIQRLNTLRGTPNSSRKSLSCSFLFYCFLDPKNADALVGDLEEHYVKMQVDFGERRAKFWYWTMAIRSVGPVALAWARKLVLKPVVYALAWWYAHGWLKDAGLVDLVTEWLKRSRI